MKRLINTLFVILLFSALVHSSNDTISVEPNQAVVQVNGIVCSFCAFGVERNLSKLNFLDKTQFGEDGVMIDINAHRVILALRQDRNIDFPLIYDAIKKGGYDPVMVYINIRGQVSKQEQRYVLTLPYTKQTFELLGSDREKWLGKGLVNIRGQLDAALIPNFQEGKAIPLYLLVGNAK